MTAGMAIFDTMNFICLMSPDAAPAWRRAWALSCCRPEPGQTLCTAQCPGHDSTSLLGGARGQATEIEIHAREIIKTRERLNKILAERTSQPLERFRTTPARLFPFRRRG